MKGSTIENNSGTGMCVHYIGGGCSWQDPIWNLTGCVEDCGPIPFNFDSVGMPSNLPAGQLFVSALEAMSPNHVLSCKHNMTVAIACTLPAQNIVAATQLCCLTLHVYD